jgi:hypothetical protein
MLPLFTANRACTCCWNQPTRQKIRLVSSNIPEALLENIDHDVLEASFGGGDERKFESRIYLSQPLTTEYNYALAQHTDDSSATGA